MPSAVIYTDGGAKPNPGFAGSAIHMYVYDDVEVKESIYTDIGYSGPLTKQGKLVNCIYSMSEAHPCEGNKSNNEAELNAFIIALDRILTYNESHDKINKVTFILDSRYVIQGIEYLPKWIDNGWMTQSGDVKNKAFWSTINDKLNEVKNTVKEINYRWVKGHSGEKGNDIVDNLATLAINSSKQNNFEKIIEVLDLEEKVNHVVSNTINLKPKTLNPLLIASKNIYLSNTDKNYYYLINNSMSHDVIGSFSSYDSYSLTILKDDYIDDSIELLTKVRENHVKNITDEYNFCYCNLDVLFNSKVLSEYAIRQDIIFKSKNNTLFTIMDKSVICSTLNPPFLAYQIYNLFEKTLNIQNNEIESITKNVFDITDYFYESIPVKKKENEFKLKVKNTIKLSDSLINVKINLNKEMNVRLLYGSHIPNKTLLSKLEPFIESIKLVTFSYSAGVTRFYVIIETSIGSRIYISPASNIILGT